MSELDIPSLLAPYVAVLSELQLGQVSTYLDLLLRWNSRMNLTAIREPENIVIRHFGESFYLAKTVVTNDANVRVIDVGSGAGFPGIPIKILHPELTITLVEAQQRKAVFLREVLRAIHLEAEVLNVRAEELVRQGATADLVTMRAVEKFDSVLPVAAGLVRPPTSTQAGGRLALLIGAAQIPVAEALLPNWRFEPFLPLPGAGTRGILGGTIRVNGQVVHENR